MSIRQVRIKLKTNEEGVQYARQHEGGGRDVCRECKRGQRNHGLFERSRKVRLMVSPRLCKGPSKGRNYVGVSEELVETKTEPIHTANAYEKDNWDDHYREPAPPYNVGSPNDNRVT
jgi:hypothetical protein